MNKWYALPLSTRWAVIAWFALLTGVLGRVTFDRVVAQSVLPIYLEGGKRWANAEPLYGPMPDDMDVYRNPPLVAVMTMPFTWMPPRAAALVWRILQISLYLLGLFQFLRDSAPPLTTMRRAIFFMLSAVLVLSSFNNAQLNLLLVACALQGTAAAARGSWWASAFWLTLAAQVKIYPLALVGLVCVAFPRTMIWRCALLLAFGLGLPIAMGNPQYALDQYRGFAEATKADDRSDSAPSRLPRDWTRLVRVVERDEFVPRQVALVVSAFAGIAFAAWVLLTRKEERLLLAFCIGLIWMVLFGPSTEMNTYSILAPAAAWLACRERSGLFAWLGVTLLGTAILRASFPTDFTHGLGFMQPLAAIFLLVACVRWYDSNSPPEPSS